jgi:uncharacterized SAM-binding protein YcdF (DUF218 family)
LGAVGLGYRDAEIERQGAPELSWRTRKILGKGLAVLSLIAAAAFFGLCGLIAHRGSIDEAQPADLILVLGAEVMEGGYPSPVLEERVAHAVQLYEQGLAPQIVVSGGIGANPPSEAEVMARLAVEQGVPPEALLLEPQARTTQQSVQLVESLLEEKDVQSIIVVSSPFHLFRATWMARDAGYTAYGSGSQEDPLWVDVIVRWRYILREACGFILYLFFGI